jgi:hypothetical protein
MKYFNSSILILVLVFTASISYGDVLWENFDSHHWIAEGWGGETPVLSYDSTLFSGKTVLRVAFSGTGSYGFFRTDHFAFENWSIVTAVKADLYFQDATTGNSPTSKLEAKNQNDTSLEQVVVNLNKNTWQTVTFPINTTLNYSTVSWIVMNIECFGGYSAMTAYIDNLRLVYNNGTIQTWDSFDGNLKSYTYGGSYATTSFQMPVYEPVSHNVTSTLTPAGAGYLSWSWVTAPQPTYAELAALNLNENWAGYSNIKYDIYTSNTSARYKIFLWDNLSGSGYAPTSQIITQPNTWTTLTFDFSSAAVAAQNPSFNRNHINQFKMVVEYIDVPGANTGTAYFDNITLVSPSSIDEWVKF